MSNLITFESSWKKSKERQLKREQYSKIIDKAKAKYELEEEQQEQARERGEGTWMLPSVEGRIEEDSKILKKKKKKKEKKKKDKRSKKKKKQKQDSSSSSESDSDEHEEPKWVEKGSSPMPEKKTIGPQLQRDSWMLAPPEGGLLPVTSGEDLRAQAKREQEQKREEEAALNEPGQHSRELNPYWKAGGKGLPEADRKSEAKTEDTRPASKSVAGDAGVGWLRKAIQRCKELAQERGVTVQQVAAERYGSWDRLQERLREAEENLMLAARERNQPSRHESRSPNRRSATRHSSSSRHSGRAEHVRRSPSSRERRRRRSRSYSSSSTSDSDSRNSRRRRSRSYDRRRGSSRDRDSYHKRQRRSRSRSGERRDRRSRSISRGRCDDYRKSDRRRSSSRERRRRDSRDRSRSRDRYNSRDTSDHRGKLSGLRSLAGKFKRPGQESDDSDTDKAREHRVNTTKSFRDSKSGSGWRKQGFMKPEDKEEDREHSKTIETDTKSGRFKRPDNDERSSSSKEPADPPKRKSPSVSGSSSSSSCSSSESDDDESTTEPQRQEVKAKEQETVTILSEQQLNQLGAKIVRAEIMGNQALADKLKAQLEAARKAKEEAPKHVQQGVDKLATRKPDVDDNEVVLTRMDKRGMVRPVATSDDTYQGRHVGKRRKVKEKTHSGKTGERQRYFADDDRHELRDLVEQEKLGTAEDHDEMFIRLAGKRVEKATEDWDVDDMFVERAANQNTDSMKEMRDKAAAIMEHKKLSSAMDKCQWCFDKIPKHLIIAIGIKTYLCLPPHKSLTDGHCMIVPMQHVTQATAVDEDVWDEIHIFRKGLTRMFEEQDEDCVFMELCKNLKYHPHMFIDCVPIPKETGDMAPLYFKKALLESETEWAQNKKVVELANKGIRKSVPSGFPYFSVDFGLQDGFAHVIEDEKSFPNYFGREIVGGMIDAGPDLWRKPHKENFDDQRRKVLQFSEWWKPYDWTQRLKSTADDSD